MSFYAVRFGRIPGIYNCWDECRKQVIGFKGAIYKKFKDKQSAEVFYNNKSNTYYIKQPSRSLKRTTTIKKDINKDPNALYIFTDGSSINNGAKNANSGFGIYIPEPEKMRLKISGKLPKGKTNNYAELKAILEALKILNCTDEKILKQTKKDKVVIVTDSQYSINCITQWYHSWIKKGWVSATGEEVKNKELIQEIQPLTVKHNVSFKHIKAHTSKKGFFYDGNRVVDKLANGMEI
jgi:ribonuclease HI